VKRYLLTLPERLVRSALGLGAGVTRELGEVALPAGVRRSQLYRSLVDTTLRFLAEQVGGAEGLSRAEKDLPDDFLARRTAGNVIEALGIVAFRASPVWILAAVADASGFGRLIIPEVAAALKTQGLLAAGVEFASMDQLLDGLERTSARLAETVNTPPLDVAGLRREWHEIREQLRSRPSGTLASRETIAGLWKDLQAEAARQGRSVFETSSVMAVAAVRAGLAQAGHVITQALIDHYRQTLADIQRVGYLKYTGRQLRPYVVAAARQFSPKRRTLTDYLLEKLRII
jgi:hypothetical protein